jgi:hypothetical protein
MGKVTTCILHITGNTATLGNVWEQMIPASGQLESDKEIKINVPKNDL